MTRLMSIALSVVLLASGSVRAFDDFYYDDDGYWEDDGYWDDGYDYGWNYGWNNNGWQQRPQYSQQPIKISMMYGEAGPVSYVLSGGGPVYNYTMQPGMAQMFREDRPWQITYDRGNGFGQQTYSLKPGHYRFKQSPRGWELFRSDSLDDMPLAQAPPPPM